jgi:hypothetical protein
LTVCVWTPPFVQNFNRKKKLLLVQFERRKRRGQFVRLFVCFSKIKRSSLLFLLFLFDKKLMNSSDFINVFDEDLTPDRRGGGGGRGNALSPLNLIGGYTPLDPWSTQYGFHPLARI